MTPSQFRAALAELNLQQRQLALALGLGTGTVNRWARGILPVPRYAEAYLELAKKGEENRHLVRHSRYLPS